MVAQRPVCVFGAILLVAAITFYLQVGQQFTWQGFVSTSKSRGAADNFAGTILFKISVNCDEAQGETYAIEVHDCSYFPNEEEVLIYPYSGFEVIGREQVADGRWMISLRTYDTLLITEDAHSCIIGPMPQLS